MGGLNKGSVAALAAAIVLAAVVGWRFLDLDSGAPQQAESGAAGASLPPSIEELRQRAETAPDDPVAWQELGLALFAANRFEEAASAYERAVEADGTSAVLWSSLGEAQVMASEADPIPAAAAEAFRRALSLDGSDPRARYFLAVEKDLGGNHEGAIAAPGERRG